MHLQCIQPCKVFFLIPSSLPKVAALPPPKCCTAPLRNTAIPRETPTVLHFNLSMSPNRSATSCDRFTSSSEALSMNSSLFCVKDCPHEPQNPVRCLTFSGDRDDAPLHRHCLTNLIPCCGQASTAAISQRSCP